MKRSFLSFALAGAVGLGMLASASMASATCTQLGGHNYAIRLVGAEVDDSTPGDPKPAPIAAVGVIAVAASPACTITGKIIYNDDGTFTGPTSSPYALFNGSNNLSGFVSFDNNNQGVLSLTQSPGGMGAATFGIFAEAGYAEFRGARVDGNPGNPLGITGEKQGTIPAPVAPATISATFLNSAAFSFEGGQSTGGVLGFGDGAVAGTVDINLNPSGSGVARAGGDLDYNNNGGTINATPILPAGDGAFVCDFDQSYVDTDTTLGYEDTVAVFNSDFMCPIANIADYTSSVVWGPVNASAWIITTASNTGAGPAPFQGVSTGQAGKIIQYHVGISPGAAVVHSTGAPVTLTITNGLGKPFDYSSITLSSGLSGFVTIAALGPIPCNTGASNVGAQNPILPAGANQCTISLVNSGTPCTASGPNHITGGPGGAGFGQVIIGSPQAAIAPSGTPLNSFAYNVTCTH